MLVHFQKESADLVETLKLLELLLGCAVQCEDKERRVTELMSLKAGVKQDLMASIQLLMQACLRPLFFDTSSSFCSVGEG